MSLASDKCQVHNRTKIKQDDPVLVEAAQSGPVYVMFPNKLSIDVRSLRDDLSEDKPCTIGEK